MRIALLSDIHGNDLALEAVLADIQRSDGAEAYWILGDLVAIGSAPVKVLERLQQLPNAAFIRGNTDRYVCSGDRPQPSPEQVKANPALLPQMMEMEANFAWTLGAITSAGWLDWLAALPVEFRETLPDGSRVLAVHASPGTDDGAGFRLEMSLEEKKAQLQGCPEQLVCVGHTHQLFCLPVDNQQIVNPGSIGLPVNADVRACYALLSADEDGYQVDLRRVDYDQQAVIESLERIRHPARKFISRRLRGER